MECRLTLCCVGDYKALFFFGGCEGEMVFAICSRAWKYTEYRLILVQVFCATRKGRKKQKTKNRKTETPTKMRMA